MKIAILDNEFAKVSYIKEDKIILLEWKKKCSGDNYRSITLCAAEELEKNSGYNFVVDARNGFEDDKEDVEWGFEILLPRMAKTGCKVVLFILERVCTIEEEMDLWTKEFSRYFKVGNAEDYENALKEIKELII